MAAADHVGSSGWRGLEAARLWQADLASFDPAIADDLAKEARLCPAYTEDRDRRPDDQPARSLVQRIDGRVQLPCKLRTGDKAAG